MPKIKALLVLLTLCMVTSFVTAQHRDLKFRLFAKDHGLSSANVTAIAQTPDGYLWIGTTDGLNRFDGYNFLSYRNIPNDSTSLSDNNITSLYVDSRGVLWIGTKTNGLNQYLRDKDRFRRYLSKLYDDRTLSSYYVTDITEDAEGSLWVGTTMGLNRLKADAVAFDRYFIEFAVTLRDDVVTRLRKENVPEDILEFVRARAGKSFATESTFHHAFIEVFDEGQYQHYKTLLFKHAILRIDAEHIKSLEADNEGSVWFCSEDRGLVKFNAFKNTTHFYTEFANAEKHYQSLLVTEDHVWLGTREGAIEKMNRSSHSIQSVKLPFPCYNIQTMRAADGTVWLGDDFGLIRIGLVDKDVQRYQYEDQRANSLSATAVTAIYVDMHKNLWTGSAYSGLNLAVVHAPFQHIRQQGRVPVSLTKQAVSAVLESSDGKVWLGYYTGGIDVWDREHNSITHYMHDASASGSVGKGTVYTLFEDKRKRIWIGSYEGGLQRFDARTNRFVKINLLNANGKVIDCKDVRDIDEDDEGNLWLSIHGGGILKYNPDTSRVQQFKADYDYWETSLANDWVFTTLIDRHGNVWVGSVFGLSVLYHYASNFVTFNRENNSLSNNHVRVLAEGPGGDIWVGTENGLNLFRTQTKDFISFHHIGLPNEMINGLIADSQHNLWISTNAGLTCFNAERSSIVNYNAAEGLQQAEFLPGAFCAGRDGSMYFGGSDGLNFFYSKDVQVDSFSVPVHLTHFSLFNKILKPGRDILSIAINETSKVELKHDQNVFSIGFVGISFPNADKVSYAYLLEGFDNDWNVGSKREVTYTNLDPGTYLFKVKAANAAGVWSTVEKHITIVISPPLWKTRWAFLSYGIAILFLLLIIRKLIIHRHDVKNKMMLQQLEAKKLVEVNELKLKLFTNISHEFKTPLTLIQGPVQHLMDEEQHVDAARRQELYRIIDRNAKQLYRLITQLLDMTALEAGFMKLRVSHQELVKHLGDIVETFQYRAYRASIQLSFQSTISGVQACVDEDKLEKILYNLLSNAIQHTPSGGKINVYLDVLHHDDALLPSHFNNDSGFYAHIVVEDNGKGIAPADKLRIFDRFYQAESNAGQTGSGIGLALTKQLIEKHRGIIMVESEPGRGSRFIVWLPISQQHYRSDELMILTPAPCPVQNNTVDRQQTNNNDRPITVTVATASHKEVDKLHWQTLLVVDDNDDIRTFININLHHEFAIIEARDGGEAYEKAVECNPDIIVSDVMMIGVNGFELCDKLKRDPATSHIPFILITGRSSAAYELEGFKNGADDYIQKPFDISVLKARIQKQLSRREVLHKLIVDKECIPESITAALGDHDEEFLKQLLHVIDIHLSDTEFSPDHLAVEMHVSRSQLYKKVKGLTGHSVSILIRNIRLKKASQRLSDKLPIAEVAYDVGFSDPAYFTRCFKELYGMSPTEFIQREKK